MLILANIWLAMHTAAYVETELKNVNAPKAEVVIQCTKRKIKHNINYVVIK